MRALFLIFVLYFCKVHCTLWSKGVVHFAISNKDYDAHSQDEIISTLNQLSREVCLKFFHTPLNYSTNNVDKILYIHNPDKRKTCPPENYDFSKSVVDLTIGYKCINPKEIARILLDMLKASIQQTVSPANSMDLVKQFQQQKEDASSPLLLTASDRNYVNAHYHTECGALTKPVPSRRTGEEAKEVLGAATQEYYRDKLWPLGVVMYRFDKTISDAKDMILLKFSMTTLEMASCLVFQEVIDDGVLQPKSMLLFSSTGDEVPMLGYKPGVQIINLKSFVHGSPGHNAQPLSNLMRVLGVPMMSNRFDRDNYVSINWKNVEKGKEHLIERAPEAAWIHHIAYDFNSITHAPANYMCANKELGAATVLPLQDHLWQRTLAMGHTKQLSASDVETLKLLYGKECERRFMTRQ